MPNFDEVAVKQPQMVSSLEVAEMLGKAHWMVLRNIEGNDKVVGIIPTLTDNKFVVSDYFIEDSYKDDSGKVNKCYQVTKMGCEVLGNKQQGEKGILFTAKYVARFNQMEQELRNQNVLAYNQELFEFDKVAKIIGLSKNDKLASVVDLMKRHDMPTLGLEKLSNYKVPDEAKERDSNKVALEYIAANNPAGTTLKEYYIKYALHCVTNNVQALEKVAFCREVRQLGYISKSRRINQEPCKVWF